MGSGYEVNHVGAQLRTLLLCALYRRTIVARCPACRREARFDAVALWWLFDRKRWDDSIATAGQRLRCSSCYAEQRKVVRPGLRINRDEPDQALPYPPEHVWKRMVSRYRS